MDHYPVPPTGGPRLAPTPHWCTHTL